MARRVLMIAFQFPPMAGTSAVQRALRFTRHLPEFGWSPLVLTAHPRAYPQTSDDQLGDVPPEVPVVRAFGLDTARHLSLFGRFPDILALPDRWASWWPAAVLRGLAAVRRHRPDAIWSTYPIATTQLVAAALHRLTGLPWIADFRDSMLDATYPRGERLRRVYARIERMVLERCTRAVFTTPGVIRMYQARYPHVPAERYALIRNGYDEESFARLGAVQAPGPAVGRPIRLLHSGVIYPSERDPRALFEALASLVARGVVSPASLEVVLRASAHDDWLAPHIERSGLAGIVRLAPAIGYRAALEEMLRVDGLLVLQGADCDHQIPAKVYEYLRAGRPILALAGDASDTRALLAESGVSACAPLESIGRIEAALEAFLADIRSGTAARPDRDAALRHSRRASTGALAGLLDRVCERPGVPAVC